eukprot:TRINITY_DN1139_c0_g1_i1.p1 TRINITY_DN1139_c0_g1~~TRINITY_DN1139_c0_g1_i1.p1  ORF type:complete len:431 (+),score=43.43 TRINITY_DN1139_c0_g1_i1:164-1294(+)
MPRFESASCINQVHFEALANYNWEFWIALAHVKLQLNEPYLAERMAHQLIERHSEPHSWWVLRRVLQLAGKMDQARMVHNFLLMEQNNDKRLAACGADGLGPLPLRSVRPIGEFEEIVLPSAPGHKYKLQTISHRPRAFRVENFLTTKECDYLISKSRPGLTPSHVTGGMGQIRNSNGFWWDRDVGDKIVDGITARAADLLGVPYKVMRESETLQVLHYPAGGYYYIHHDAVGYAEDTTFAPRYATILYYLNDPESGGETAFPIAPSFETLERNVTKWWKCYDSGIVSPAKRGDAMFFYSYTADGRLDYTAAHQACPVHKGEKWLANHWVGHPIPCEAKHTSGKAPAAPKKTTTKDSTKETKKAPGKKKLQPFWRK